MAGSILSRIYLSIVLLPFAGLVAAEQPYTYVKASLAYPWFMFFVFLALIAIPFFLIIALSWRLHRKNESSHTAAGGP